MNDRGVRIKYGNFAPGAKESFVASTSDSKFNTLSQLQQYIPNFPNYTNPCEMYQTLLDGTSMPVPSYPSKFTYLGLWSKQISGEDGFFESPIVLEMIAGGQFVSQAISFNFDIYNGIFCNKLNIKWYRDDELLSNLDFYPNAAQYSCENQVKYYNKLIITFYSINMPGNRLKLTSIDHGYFDWFEAKNLKSVKLVQEINQISSEISINTADFTLNADAEEEFLFQGKQALSIYFNGKLRSTSFIRSVKRRSKTTWDIQADDYIGLMDSVPYYGGIYDKKKAVTVLSDIFEVAKVPYKIYGDFSRMTVTGYIPYTTCREALMQLAFAIGTVVDTSNSDVVKIFEIPEDITQDIPLSRIMQGQSFNEEEEATSVEVVAHAYRSISDTTEVYNASKSGASKKNDDGSYEKIFVKFSEPIHDLKITGNGRFAVSDDGLRELKHTNYAVIYAYDETCVLTGGKYEHNTITKRKDNPLVLASEVEKVVSVEDATLVSADNVDKVLEKCYNYYTKTSTVNMKIVEGKHITGGSVIKYGQLKYGKFKYGTKAPIRIAYDATTNVGDKIRAETEYLGSIEGIIEKQTFNLNGGIIVKDCTVR